LWFLRGLVGAVFFFGFEPDIVRRVETSRSGLYEGLGCSEGLVRVVKALVMAGF
jgi:hypothetical protein